MALRFNMTPYQPIDMQGQREVYSEIGEDLGTALKEVQERYGAANVAYNEYIAKYPDRASNNKIPPLNVWAKTDIGKAMIRNKKAERRARFANTPWGKLAMSKVGPEAYEDMVDQDAFSTAMTQYGNIEIAGWGKNKRGFDPTAYLPGQGGFGTYSSWGATGAIDPEVLQGLADQEWYKAFVKDAEAGKWQPGGEHYNKYVQREMPSGVFGDIGIPFVGPLKAMHTLASGQAREGKDAFQDWLKDYYTVEGIPRPDSAPKNEGGGLLNRLFGNKKRKSGKGKEPNILDMIQNRNQTNPNINPETGRPYSPIGKFYKTNVVDKKQVKNDKYASPFTHMGPIAHSSENNLVQDRPFTKGPIDMTGGNSLLSNQQLQNIDTIWQMAQKLVKKRGR